MVIIYSIAMPALFICDILQLSNFQNDHLLSDLLVPSQYFCVDSLMTASFYVVLEH